ncbi:NUC188 domain-containing protein [Vararia minispora EC-137]|uniref:NUC188 domain-containing protein n=1 Tax=Vararia minispora EC-137 TaxID=1314806 RepID=A0ACB8QF43_9AGAM|nr:NUC188 domain-containing protein [Vararia minispora EC-137]
MSRLNIQDFEGMKSLPTTLDVEAFTEIDAMKRKALGRERPKRGRKNQVPRDVELLKRQAKKKWLESHLWHAKRMRMEDMWGYRLAVQPTEKAFRPSHRASVHGSILHDASYHSLIELVGEEPVLEYMLLACCDPQGPHPSSARFKGGVRMCEAIIYKLGEYPCGLIGPVSLVWRPIPGAAPRPESSAKGKSRRRGIKERGANVAEVSNRTIWIFCHPLLLDELLRTFKLVASKALEALKVQPEHADMQYTCEVADMTGSVNIFEIMGAKSSQVIHGALTPALINPEFRQFWSQLANVQTSGSTPSSMVIAFTVHDPRLNFPPKNTKPRIDKEPLPSMSQVWTCMPSATLADGDIWKAASRVQVQRFTKKDLDQRRAQTAIPGTALIPTESDDTVPVMLIQRSLGCSSSCAEPSLHGWTLLVPRGWSMPFLSSLMYTGTRIGGLRERQHQSFEAGIPHFPRDFPACDAYFAFAQERAKTDKARWDCKPPAKRSNWEKLGVRSPWAPDWDVVLGTAPGEDASFVTTQRGSKARSTKIEPWLLRGPGVRKVVDNMVGMFNPAAGIWHHVNQLRLKRGMEGMPSDGNTVDALFRGALVRINLNLVGRGAPEDMAILSDVLEEEILQFRKAELETNTGSILDKEGDEDENNHQLKMTKVLGYVTSGNYSLSRGEAYALGAMSVAAFLDLKNHASRHCLPKPLIKVRNRDGRVARYAYVDIVED